MRIRTSTGLLLVGGSCGYAALASLCKLYRIIAADRSVGFCNGDLPTVIGNVTEFHCAANSAPKKSVSKPQLGPLITASIALLLYGSKDHLSKASIKYGKLRLL